MRNLKGELLCLKTENIKPNFSELSRIYGIDRRTIKKQYLGLINEQEKKKKVSVLDKHKNLIKEKLKIPGTNKKAVYMYIVMNVDKNIGSYSNFRKYVLKHNDELIQKNVDVHVRFETEYGKQLQFDWKGPIRLKNKYNEIFDFYIFSTTLSGSRFHTFIYSKFMTLEEVERCLIETFQIINGVPIECLTDNMSSIINHSEHQFTNGFKTFSKDMDFIPKKCKPKHAYTKGKDESCNRFMSWLIPYNGEFETEEELIKIIENINIKINRQTNETIGVPPIMLFQKEKEYLKPLPNDKILNSYLYDTVTSKVSNESLFYYKGSKYSVPIKFINHTLTLREENNKLYVYYNKELITIHQISEKYINYKEEHYNEGFMNILKNKTQDEINEIARKNLELINKLSEV